MQLGVFCMQALSKILKELRMGQGLTQETLADALGLSRYMVSYYEGGREPPVDVLAAYAKYFNVSGDYLLGLTVEKRHETSDISAMLSQLATLVTDSGGSPLFMDDITKLLDSFVSYYKTNASAGHAPLDSVTVFLRAMPLLLDALARNDTAATLENVNRIAMVTLSINKILVGYLEK